MYSEVVEQINDNARIIVEPEQESYFDVFGEPEGYENGDDEWVPPEQEREEIYELIERDGLWWFAAQRKCPCCGAWETVGSIGMVIGDLDPMYREELVKVATNEEG